MSEHPYAAPPPDNVVQGIAPPHSIESEQGVLGAVLLSDRAMYAYVVESQLRSDDFYRERHRVIFGAMVELYGDSEPIDVLTVTEHLRARAQLMPSPSTSSPSPSTSAPARSSTPPAAGPGSTSSPPRSPPSAT